VRQLVGTHLALGYLLHTDRSRRERWKLLRELEPVAAEAVVLSVGDRLATAGPDDRRRWVRAHQQLARDVWADHWREQRDGRPTPLLDGSQIAAIAGIQPGPALGELVHALAEAQGIGEVQTRDQAEALVRLRAATAPQP
jgi:poly(A) polymerase